MDVSSPETWRWIWLALGVAFAVGEIAVAGSFFLLPFAVGAFLAAGAAFLGGSVALEWLLFVAGSGAASAVMWPLGRRLDRRAPRSPIGAHRWVGREGFVLRDIPGQPGGTGLIRLDREEWRAESLTGTRIAAGSTVLVSRLDGTRLVVVALEEPAIDLAPPASLDASAPPHRPASLDATAPPHRPPASTPHDPAAGPGTPS